MNFKLEIDCDNAAFEEDLQGEVARILRDTGAHLKGMTKGYPEGVIRDVNGNTVGHWRLTLPA